MSPGYLLAFMYAIKKGHTLKTFLKGAIILVLVRIYGPFTGKKKGV